MPRPRTRSPRKRLPGPEVCAHDPDQSRPNTVMKGPPARRIDPSGVPFRKFEEEFLRTLRGLRPHPLPLALDPALPGCCAKRTRGALRRDWTTRPPTQPSVAERPSAPCTALRRAQCSAVQVSLRVAPRGEDLKEAGGRKPPASFKTSPLPRLYSLLGTLTRAGGGARGGGGGRPRPFGLLPWRGREAARRDHQPQLVRELMTRDTSRLPKTAAARKEAGTCADSSPSGLAFSACS